MGNSGWNRPSAAPKVAPKKSPALKHGILAGVLVVALGGLCLWMFSGGDAAPRAKPAKDRGRIKEVAPAKAKKSAEKAPGEPKAASKPMQEAEQDQPKFAQSKRDESKKPKRDSFTPYHGKTLGDTIFSNRSDVAISHLLNLEPGTSILGTYHYGPEFEKDLLAAQNKPIVVNADDSDEVRTLKEAVIEARKELMARYKSGEDVCKVMAETRQELQQLGLYRQQLEQQVSKIATEDGKLTEKDANDLVAAANLMLKEHGAKPIEMPIFLKYKFQQMKDGEADEEGEVE